MENGELKERIRNETIFFRSSNIDFSKNECSVITEN